MRSRPEDAIWLLKRNFADLMLAVWPPALADDEVAMHFPDVFQMRRRPSYEPDKIRSCPCDISALDQIPVAELDERTSTLLIQSSCSKLA